MKYKTGFGSALSLLAALTLGACATTNYPPNPGDSHMAGAGSAYTEYGVVQSVELVRQEHDGIGGSGVGLGTIAGAVVGGIVGNQVGSGRGNTAATVVGAAGGAYVGHQLENRQQQHADADKITIRMEDGSYQTVMEGTNAGFRVGDRVRLSNGVLRRY